MNDPFNSRRLSADGSADSDGTAASRRGGGRLSFGAAGSSVAASGSAEVASGAIAANADGSEGDNAAPTRGRVFFPRSPVTGRKIVER